MNSVALVKAKAEPHTRRTAIGLKPICVIAGFSVLIGIVTQWWLVGWGTVVVLTVLAVLGALIVGLNWNNTHQHQQDNRK